MHEGQMRQNLGATPMSATIPRTGISLARSNTRSASSRITDWCRLSLSEVPCSGKSPGADYFVFTETRNTRIRSYCSDQSFRARLIQVLRPRPGNARRELGRDNGFEEEVANLRVG